MAITQSSATLDQSEREALLKSKVNSSILTGSAKDKGGEKLAGITAEFATNVKGAIDDYIAEVDERIAEMEEEEKQNAFKGTGIDAALTTFVSSIKTVATEYTGKLKTAEQQIIDSVADVYSKQDEEISQGLTTDSTKLDEENPVPKV